MTNSNTTNMETTRIDGKALAQELRKKVAQRVTELKARGIEPGLTVVLVGDDPASQVYVRNKDRAATDAGFKVDTVRMPADISQEQLEGVVDELNSDESVHGILVQLPLPKELDADAIVRRLNPAKDVDGLHPENVAALVTGGRGLFPCTPAGCLEMLDRQKISLEGKHVVVIGRSMLVGKPVASMCLARNATVTICHSRTKDLAEVVRGGDIVIAAVGRAKLVQGDWISPGAVVLDVGINRGDDGKLVGDVDYEAALGRASHMTPVPGGVGPMTIAMLLSNTALAAARLGGQE